MREDIKERIGLIRRRDVPEEYKMTDKGIIPINWEVVQLGDRVNIFRGASPRPKGDSRYYGGRIPRVLIEDLTRDGKIVYPCLDSLTEEGAKKSRFLKKGSIIMSCSGTKVGITGFLGVDACIHDGFFGFDEFEGLDAEYLYYLIQYETDLLQIKATKGGVFNNLTTDIMKTLLVSLPSLKEQIKIAQILGEYDKYQNYLTKLIIEKKRIKNMLSDLLLTGNKRIAGFEEIWSKRKLKDLLVEVDIRTKQSDEYPILTSSRRGIFFQEEYFNKIVASKNNVGYKVIGSGEFTYRAMSDDGNYTFNIQEICEKGMVSPAYDVFKVNTSLVCGEYIYYMLNAKFFGRFLRKIQQGGTRQALSFKNLIKIEIAIPELKEQRKIADILSTADREITLYEKKLELIRLEKKLFMRFLLTGLLRVDET